MSDDCVTFERFILCCAEDVIDCLWTTICE
jgi:hypothetical protein